MGGNEMFGDLFKDLNSSLEDVLKSTEAGEGTIKDNMDDLCDILADEILKTLIQNGKGIEVHTGAYKAGLGVPNPCPDLLFRYR